LTNTARYQRSATRAYDQGSITGYFVSATTDIGLPVEEKKQAVRRKKGRMMEYKYHKPSSAADFMKNNASPMPPNKLVLYLNAAY